MRRVWLVILVLLAGLGLARSAPSQVLTGTTCPSAQQQLVNYAAEAIPITVAANAFLTAANLTPPAAMVVVTNTGPGTAFYTTSGTAAVAIASGGFSGGHLGAGTSVNVCGAHAASAFLVTAYNGTVNLYAMYYRVR